MERISLIHLFRIGLHFLKSWIIRHCLRHQIKKEKKRNNAIPANSLVAGSVWKCQGNGNPLKLIKRAFIRDIVSSYRGFTGQTYKICHSGNSKNGLVINCISDGKLPRKRCICNLHLVARLKKDGGGM